MTAVKPTPRQVAQLYKAVLRYATAAVLYARPAKPNLRALYRPEFDIWMAAAKEPGSVKPEAWLEFARRTEHTLRLLHRSSLSNGVPHKLTQSLANMRYHVDPPRHIRRRQSAKLLPEALFMSRPSMLNAKAARQQGSLQKLYAFDAFADLISMAEGSSGLVLGKVRPRKPIWE